MKSTRKIDKEELAIARKECLMNGYVLHEAENILFIRTKFSNWRIQKTNTKYLLFHQNSLDFKATYSTKRRRVSNTKHFSNEYHLQKKYDTMLDVIKFIYRHDRFVIENMQYIAN